MSVKSHARCAIEWMIAFAVLVGFVIYEQRQSARERNLRSSEKIGVYEK